MRYPTGQATLPHCTTLEQLKSSVIIVQLCETTFISCGGEDIISLVSHHQCQMSQSDQEVNYNGWFANVVVIFFLSVSCSLAFVAYSDPASVS